MEFPEKTERKKIQVQGLWASNSNKGIKRGSLKFQIHQAVKERTFFPGNQLVKALYQVLKTFVLKGSSKI